MKTLVFCCAFTILSFLPLSPQDWSIPDPVPAVGDKVEFPPTPLSVGPSLKLLWAGPSDNPDFYLQSFDVKAQIWDVPKKLAHLEVASSMPAVVGLGGMHVRNIQNFRAGNSYLVIFRGKDNFLWAVLMDSQGAFGGVPFKLAANKIVFDPIAMRSGDTINIFFVSQQDGHLWKIAWAVPMVATRINGVSRESLRHAPEAEDLGFGTYSQPTLVTGGPHVIEVLFGGPDGKIWSAYTDNGQQWSHAEVLKDSSGNSVFITGLNLSGMFGVTENCTRGEKSVKCVPVRRASVYFSGAHGYLHQLYSTNGSSWSVAQEFPGVGSRVSVVCKTQIFFMGSPALVPPGPGQKNQNNRVYRSFQPPPANSVAKTSANGCLQSQ